MLDYHIAGEKSPRGSVLVVEGMPAGLPVDLARLNEDLERYARPEVEPPGVEVLGGLKGNVTLGSPIAIFINDRHVREEGRLSLTAPRPGEVDLSAVMKFQTQDFVEVLEGRNAGFLAPRVAAGSLAKILLSQFDISVIGYVVRIGKVSSRRRKLPPQELETLRRKSAFYTLDPALDSRVATQMTKLSKLGDTIGGVFEVAIFNAPPGLGSTLPPEARMEGRLSLSLMSIPLVASVELGLGAACASRLGSQVHDGIFYREEGSPMRTTGGFYRKTNHAGGIEGGLTNGEVILLRASVKGAPPQGARLRTVDIRTKESRVENRPSTSLGVPRTLRGESRVEQTNLLLSTPNTQLSTEVCAVPKASVVAEAVVAFEIARAMVEKFGGDSIGEMKHNYCGYLEYIHNL